MRSGSYHPGKEYDGFVKISGNKYVAPITAIVPTQRTEPDELGTVGIPETVFQMLEGEGHIMGRVNVSNIEEESFGQYSGKPANVEPVPDWYGAIIPDYAATAVEDFSIHGGNGIYRVEEWEEEPTRVCLTFPDEDNPMSLQAQGYEKIGESDAATAYYDLRTDGRLIHIKEQ